jgi:hypothetical protein
MSQKVLRHILPGQLQYDLPFYLQMNLIAEQLPDGLSNVGFDKLEGLAPDLPLDLCAIHRDPR